MPSKALPCLLLGGKSLKPLGEWDKMKPGQRRLTIVGIFNYYYSVNCTHSLEAASLGRDMVSRQDSEE